ncbi:unnamed protein product, partial [Gulo gulo]
LSPEFWLLSFPPPPRSRLLPPPRFSPTSVRYLSGGGRRGCPVFTRGTTRRGSSDTGRNESKYLNTDARVRGWDRHLTSDPEAVRASGR